MPDACAELARDVRRRRLSQRRPRRSPPSACDGVERIVWLIVSPVASAAAMIVVPSISPTTIRAERARRRRSVAHAQLEEDAVAQGENAKRTGDAASSDREDERQRLHRYAEQLFHGMPPSTSTAGSSASTTW